MEIINSIINAWIPRKLTLKGKITVIKSLILPHIQQLASVYPFSNSYISKLDTNLFNFLWSIKKHLVSKASLLLPLELGGLKMISSRYVCRTAHIMFIKSLCNNINAKWKALTEFLMGFKISELFIKKSALNLQPNVKTSYYKSILSTWFNLILTKPTTINQFLAEDLFENPLFTTDDHIFGKEYNNWKEAGISKVSDVFHEAQKCVLNKVSLEIKYNISIKDMNYNRLSNCVNTKLKSLSYFPCIDRFSLVSFARKCLNNIADVKSPDVSTYYVMLNYKTPTSQDKWIEYYPFLEHFDWSDVYSLASKVTLDTYLITLQLTILHRIYNCNYNLYIWKIKDSSQCDFCSGTDNLEHFFFYCPVSNLFWIQFSDWLNTSLQVCKSMTVLEILLGVTNVQADWFYWLNFAVIIAKYFISKCKQKATEPCLVGFIKVLKSKIVIEKVIYKNKGRDLIFNTRFRYLDNALHD